MLEIRLRELAQRYPVVTITGPRQSGKTTLCRHIFRDHKYVNLEAPDVRRLAVDDPRSFLARYGDGAIFDEIQRAPELPSYLQVMVDEDPRPGRFILTGSQQLEVTQSVSQSLAGRTALCRLLPFSIAELYGEGMLPDIDDLLYSGFYPRIHDQGLPPSEALSFYLNTYVERDLRTLLRVRDLRTFETFLRLCAANVGQLLNLTRMSNDCGIARSTINEWVSILKASYILFELPPHFRNYRKRMVKSRKIYFWDVGLAAYLLGIRNPSHVRSHPLRGNLFENCVIADILKSRLHSVVEENAYFFRDSNGNEVDLLLEVGPELLAVEIKSAQTFHPSMLKGLAYYNRLRENPGGQSLLIYGGEGGFEHRGVGVRSIFDLKGGPLLDSVVGLGD